MNAFFKESFELKDEDLTFRLDEQKKQDEEYRYDDSYDIWDDDHEYYDEEPIETIPDRINFAKYGKKSVTNGSDILDEIPASIYCDLVTTLTEKCVEHSLLEMWRFSSDLISSTTTQEIVDAVNWLETSPWFGHQAHFSQLLGGIKRNSS